MAGISKFQPSKGVFYILLSFVFWVVVEYITVWASRFGVWISLMPAILIQYLVIVLVFYYFIFRKKWNERNVFVVMMIMMYVFEILWQNFFLTNMFLFVPGTLLLISVWGFITFIPLWVVNKTTKKHKPQGVYFLLWIIVAVITLLV